MSADHEIDRTGWAPGPWDAEPDRLEWRYRGLPCLIVRSKLGGALCGYVGVPAGHPAHGVHYDNIDASAHGGVTYAAPCDVDGPICHVPKPGEAEDTYWIGFDCGHAFDIQPGHDARLRQMRFDPDPSAAVPWHYWTIGDVMDEVERLADQLVGMRP